MIALNERILLRRPILYQSCSAIEEEEEEEEEEGGGGEEEELGKRDEKPLPRLICIHRDSVSYIRFHPSTLYDSHGSYNSL
jgi:hypothetical protein